MRVNFKLKLTPSCGHGFRLISGNRQFNSGKEQNQFLIFLNKKSNYLIYYK